jgi:hypothetical protein
MENLPFLSKGGEPLPSRSAPPLPQQAESEYGGDEPQQRFYPAWPQPQVRQGAFDSLKDNHIALILIGIVIGVLIMNMRPPIIVKP